MIRRAPRALSPAQRDVLEAAEASRVVQSWKGWYVKADRVGRGHYASPTIEALIRAELLKTGPLLALGTQRLAVLTDAGRATLTKIRDTEQAEP